MKTIRLSKKFVSMQKASLQNVPILLEKSRLPEESTDDARRGMALENKVMWQLSSSCF